MGVPWLIWVVGESLRLLRLRRISFCGLMPAVSWATRPAVLFVEPWRVKGDAGEDRRRGVVADELHDRLGQRAVAEPHGVAAPLPGSGQRPGMTAELRAGVGSGVRHLVSPGAIAG